MTTLDKSFVRGALYTFASQVVPFILKTLSIRYLKPEEYAISGFQLRLLLICIMQLVKDGFRKGLARGNRREESIVFRLAAVTPILGLVFTIVGCSFFIVIKGRDEDENYVAAVAMYGVSCFIKILGEPLHILTQVRSDFRTEFLIFFLAVICGRLSTLLFIKYKILAPLIAFSIGETILGAVSCLLYLLYGYITNVHKFAFQNNSKYYDINHQSQANLSTDKTNEFDNDDKISPNDSDSDDSSTDIDKDQTKVTGKVNSHRQQFTCRALGFLWNVDKELYNVCIEFTQQAFWLLIQSQGSNVLLMFMISKQSQGIYGLVSNIGSFIAGFIFWPIEKSAFIMFSQSNPNDEQARLNTLSKLSKLTTFFGILGILYGPQISPNIIYLYGQNWTGSMASDILSFYWVFIALKGFKCLLEAYIHAVMNSSKLKFFNNFLVFMSVFHLVFCFVLIWKLGTIGLIVAECVNVFGRIVFAMYFIKVEYKFQWRQLLQMLFPQMYILVLLCGISFSTSYQSRNVIFDLVDYFQGIRKLIF
eukprot:TRINITY_DN23343_c1_g1_i2.p1 TRINITY_DN23343_c1_g1~~TRINITY_DN23343_c1_g1_i2.p1  ORF type:complete len:533 (-),score=19.53 TRINITY_DN23343_c1_g1_i2:190-1788(-)